MYADDTHVTYAGSDPFVIQSNLNADLENISYWLAVNKLTLNMTKTEFLLIGSRQKLDTLAVAPNLELNETPIKQVDSVKSLGILIDSNLTWKNQIEQITKKIASGIGALKRIRPYVQIPTLHLIFKALVQPHFLPGGSNSIIY